MKQHGVTRDRSYGHELRTRAQLQREVFGASSIPANDQLAAVLDAMRGDEQTNALRAALAYEDAFNGVAKALGVET